MEPLQSSFLKLIKRSSPFVWPVEEDVTEVEKEDILTSLPAPSIGFRGELKYSISFTSSLTVF